MFPTNLGTCLFLSQCLHPQPQITAKVPLQGAHNHLPVIAICDQAGGFKGRQLVVDSDRRGVQGLGFGFRSSSPLHSERRDLGPFGVFSNFSATRWGFRLGELGCWAISLPSLSPAFCSLPQVPQTNNPLVHAAIYASKLRTAYPRPPP